MIELPGAPSHLHQAPAAEEVRDQHRNRTMDKDAALSSLKPLNKGGVVEVRALQRPPTGVKLVAEVFCLMREVQPKKVTGDKPGVNTDCYWEVGKAQLQDPTKFLENLFKQHR